MNTNTVKKNGKEYILSGYQCNTGVVLTVNGNPIDKVWSISQRNIYYSPYVIDSKNYWVVMINNNPYLMEGGDSMTEEDFLKDYATKPYNGFAYWGYIFFLLVIPTFVIDLIKSLSYGVDNFFGTLLLFCSLVWFGLINTYPFVSTKKRRVLCHVSLIGVLLNLLNLLLVMF